ncbi:hypothetical protein [Hymenobacter algoricola]|uniref:Uncharacterized protein n=1 Tax=Hymenobacter algoricola TaxID=486267 RepID=A0ABP7NN90_9BACT
MARRINRQLRRYITSEFSTVDSTASPHRQLYQAARQCCYDEEQQLWRAGVDGPTGTEYSVLLNRGGGLSIAFQNEYQGLPEPATHHLTLDLRTGRRLSLADLGADPPAQLRQRLGAAVSRRLRDELAHVAARYGDPTVIGHVAELYRAPQLERHARPGPGHRYGRE